VRERAWKLTWDVFLLWSSGGCRLERSVSRRWIGPLVGGPFAHAEARTALSRPRPASFAARHHSFTVAGDDDMEVQMRARMATFRVDDAAVDPAMSQNSSVTSFRRSAGWAVSGAPQPLQKRAPSRLSASHAEHTTIVQAC